MAIFKIHRLTWLHAHPPGPNCCEIAIYNANPDPNSNLNPKEPTPNPNPKAIEAFPESRTPSHFLDFFLHKKTDLIIKVFFSKIV